MNLVEAYIAGVKELKTIDPRGFPELYDLQDSQLCDLWEDMSDRERAEASTIYIELWPR